MENNKVWRKHFVYIHRNVIAHSFNCLAILPGIKSVKIQLQDKNPQWYGATDKRNQVSLVGKKTEECPVLCTVSDFHGHGSCKHFWIP